MHQPRGGAAAVASARGSRPDEQDGAGAVAEGVFDLTTFILSFFFFQIPRLIELTNTKASLNHFSNLYSSFFEFLYASHVLS